MTVLANLSIEGIRDKIKRLVGKEIYSVPGTNKIGQKGPSNIGFTFTKDLTEQICNQKNCTVEEFKKKYSGKVKLWLDYEDGEIYIITKIVPSEEKKVE